MPPAKIPWAFFFSAKVPPGIYRVTVLLGGDGAKESVTTVKSETRRLMLEDIKLAPGEEKSYSFWVHVRVPARCPRQAALMPPSA